MLAEFKKSSDITGSTPIFNLNLMTSDYPYQLAMLYHAKEIGLPVKYIELGNEFYIDLAEHRLSFPSVIDYADKAKQWAADLKSATLDEDHDAKPQVAVVGAWSNPLQDGRQRMWLSNLMNEIALDDNIDAITMHQYIGSGLSVLSVADGSCLSTVAGGAMDGIPNPNIMMMRPFKNMEFLKDNDFAIINGTSEGTKEIWITEFNMGDQNYATHGSWAQAMMVSTMLLAYLEEPNVAKVLPHDLVGSAYRSSLFNNQTNNLDYAPASAPYDPVNTNQNTVGGTINHPCDGFSESDYDTQPWGKSGLGSAVALISRAIEESETAAQIDFNFTGMIYLDSPVSTNYPVLYGWKFTKDYSNEFIILNLGNDAMTVNMSTIAAGLGVGYYERLNAPWQYYITGDVGGGTTFEPGYNGRVYFTPATPLQLTPYSITRVVLTSGAPCVLKLVATEDTLCIGASTTLTVYQLYPHATTTLWTASPSLQLSGIAGLNDCKTITPTTSGTYTVTVSDATCSASASIKVSEPPSLAVSSTGSLSICPGVNTPPILTALCTGGAGSGYKYIWTPSYGLSTTISPSTPFSRIVLAAPDSITDYIVYATDGVCWVSSKGNPVTVNSLMPNIHSITGPLVKCLTDGSNDVNLTVEATDATGLGSLSYAWSSGGSAATETVDGTSTDTYTVTVTNTVGGSGCTASVSTTIKVNENCCLTEVNSGDVVIYKESDPFISNVTKLKTEINNVNSYYTFTDATSTTDNLVEHPPTVPPNPPPVIYINGYFSVNEDLTFIDCKIRLGEQAEVHVKAGVTLRFTGCDIAGCGTDGTLYYTWRSIYADDPASTIIVENLDGTRTNINDADTALNLSNDAQYNIINCDFENNYHSIYLYNYMQGVKQKTDMGNIYGNTFSASALKTSPVGSFAYGLSGISLNYTEDLTIGKATEDANTFEDLCLGIDSKNANFHAYNNHFNSMQPAENGFLGYCILSGSVEDANDRTVAIGSYLSSDYANNFDNSSDGILTFGEQNIIIDGNNFGVNGGITDVSIGIYYNGFGIDKHSKTIQIQNNTIQNFSLGTYLRNIIGENNVTINNNTYSDAVLSSNTNFNGTAITVQNDKKYQRVEPFLIFNNHITNARIGIHAINTPGISIGLDETGNAFRNRIEFNLGATPDAGIYYEGIWLQNCNKSLVIGGGPSMSPTADITNDYPSGSTDKFRAIDIENSTDCSINCNSILNLSRSITFTGLCKRTLLRNNGMAEYEKAIELFSASMSNQFQLNGTTKEPLDNQWFDASANDRVTGIKATTNPINWYYQSSNTDFDPDPLSASFIILHTPAAAGTVLCDDYSNIHSRDEMLGDVVGDSLELSEYEDENTYLAKMDAYNYMKSDTSILYLEEENDEDYLDFYHEMELLNIGSFTRVNELSRTTELIPEAVEVNDAIDDENDIEYYMKAVNEIYLNTTAIALPLSSTDSSTLESIANMNWYEAGEAIYTAAAMLGLEIHPTEGSSMRLGNSNPAATAKSELANESITILPNPAKDFFVISSTSAVIKNIMIYDMQGNKVKEITGDAGGKSIPINLSQGLYRIIITDTDNNTEYNKLIIIK